VIKIHGCSSEISRSGLTAGITITTRDVTANRTKNQREEKLNVTA